LQDRHPTKESTTISSTCPIARKIIPYNHDSAQGNQTNIEIETTPQNTDCPENLPTNIISILCNTIVGLDNKYGKMSQIIQVINKRNIDIFMGQELN
jgi:hypothetical protein